MVTSTVCRHTRNCQHTWIPWPSSIHNWTTQHSYWRVQTPSQVSGISLLHWINLITLFEHKPKNKNGGSLGMRLVVTMVADKLRRLWLRENVNGLRQSKQETDPYRSPYNHNPSHHTDKLDVCGSHLICQVFPKLEDRCGTFLMHACYGPAIYLYM